jgi:polysaccharide deacetylase family protein (PEP-CTERM system associated)
MTAINALTIDVEDYFQVSAFEHDVDRTTWDQYESRVVANTHRILQLLRDRGVKATFFVLGWIAERFPKLVHDIHSEGHEVASHGYWHRLIYQQTRDEFREDIVRSREVLEGITGEPIVSYRAPSFSITKRSLWAIQILAEERFQIDSSIYPVYHDRYGIPDANPRIHSIETEAGNIWEFPVAVHKLGPLNLPVSGGGYFRLYPLRWSFHCLEKINKRQHRPFVFYLHPWELDPDQPRLPIRSRTARLRHYVNLRSTDRKFEALLDRFEFAPLRQVTEDAVRAEQL